MFGNSVAQSSHCFTDIATLAVAFKLVNYHTFVIGWDAVLKTVRHNWLGNKYYSWIHWIITLLGHFPYVLFNLVWSQSHIREFDCHWALGWSNRSWLHHSLPVELDSLHYQILRISVVNKDICDRVELIIKGGRRTYRQRSMAKRFNQVNFSSPGAMWQVVNVLSRESCFPLQGRHKVGFLSLHRHIKKW